MFSGTEFYSSGITGIFQIFSIIKPCKFETRTLRIKALGCCKVHATGFRKTDKVIFPVEFVFITRIITIKLHDNHGFSEIIFTRLFGIRSSQIKNNRIRNCVGLTRLFVYESHIDVCRSRKRPLWWITRRNCISSCPNCTSIILFRKIRRKNLGKIKINRTRRNSTDKAILQKISLCGSLQFREDLRKNCNLRQQLRFRRRNHEICHIFLSSWMKNMRIIRKRTREQ